MDLKKKNFNKTTQKHLFYYILSSGWPGLEIFALIRPRHFFRSYTSSLFKLYRFKSFFAPSCHDFLARPFFLFPVISTSITSRIWELMSPCMIWPYHRRQLWIILNLYNTQPITKNISQHPINQSHLTHHPDHTTHPTQPPVIRNSKFPHFTTLQENWSNVTLINLPLLLQR